VSRGIAAALLATAVGIFTALYGLIGHNILHRQSGLIDSAFKIALLFFTRPDLREVDASRAS
jgi:biopolymer transport protein ExbB